MRVFSLLITGHFFNIDEGNRLKRNAIGTF